jgi:hypothetical protein
MESDSAYYRRRAEEQRHAAAMAGDTELRRRHLELAEMLDRHSEVAEHSLSPAGRGLG